MGPVMSALPAGSIIGWLTWRRLASAPSRASTGSHPQTSRTHSDQVLAGGMGQDRRPDQAREEALHVRLGPVYQHQPGASRNERLLESDSPMSIVDSVY